MTHALFACDGGTVVLPARDLVLVDRADGGNLIVNPPREVWERNELNPDELTMWSFLVASTANAMLETLPQLDGGCINYWEAGNWALNDEAEPRGPKLARDHRRVHMHLLGRSPRAQSPAWKWGEAPMFPPFSRRHEWAAAFERLLPEECRRIIAEVEQSLVSRWGVSPDRVRQSVSCARCGYPRPSGDGSPCS